MNIPVAIALVSFAPFGPATLIRLWRAYPTLEPILQASEGELLSAGVPAETAATFVAERGKLDASRTLERARELGISIATIEDAHYPAGLRETAHPPLLLFFKGRLPTREEPTVAIVGTRVPTPYGRAMAYEFAGTLAAAGCVVTSGLALGIDTIAHTAALEAGGRTVAVLGCGLDTIYPSANRALAERIVGENGALLSEYPPGVPPLRHHFPLRNRIIAGLSAATLVVEGTSTSGSLITAREALEANRDVFAIPGDIGRAHAEGPNALLRAGAAVALEPGDILGALELAGALPLEHAPSPPSDEPEKTVLSALDKTPKSIDDVVQCARVEATAVAAALTTLEMKQLVRDVGGGLYVKV